MNPPEPLSEIYNFRSLGAKLATGGQPTEAQLRLIREAGFDTVINLALPSSDNALPNEGSLVTGMGMTYVHIPVNFKAPTSQDFRAFCGVMRAFEGRPAFVHCAANMRVSAFMYLYRVMFKDVPASEARQDLNAVWQPDDVWSQFIEQQLEGNRP
jgi:protein tyrosine phosphatase (PTP) superfamily phosphohydrolase (DUF442 family)